MKKIRITTDSTCDIDLKTLKERNIGIAHLKTFDNKTNEEVSKEELFSLLQQGHKITTSAPNLIDYEDLFTETLENYDDVIHLNMSGKMSASYKNALLAKEELNTDRITVIDTNNLTMALALIVLYSSDITEETNNKKEALELIKDYIKRVEMLVVPETVKYATGGGRLAAPAFNLMNLKAQLKMVKGLPKLVGKSRGTYLEVATKYFSKTLNDLFDIDIDRAVFGYSSNKEDIDIMMGNIPNIQEFLHINTFEAGPVISSHVGPNTLALSYARKKSN